MIIVNFKLLSLLAQYCNYQNDSCFSGFLDFLEQRPEVVGVGKQLPHRDLEAVEGAKYGLE
jgi:hypothetical protein